MRRPRWLIPLVSALLAILVWLGLRAWRFRHRDYDVAVPPRPAALLAPSMACAEPRGEAPRGAALAHDGLPTLVWGPAPSSTPRALVLMLHGYKSSGADFASWAPLARLAGDDAYVVYPDAPDGVWDVLGARDLDALERLVHDAADRYCIDTTQILVVGFSHGARMAHHLACKRGGLVRGLVAAEADWTDRQPACAGPTPVLVVHREADTDEGIHWAREGARKWAVVDGCAAEPATSELGADCIDYPACRAPGRVTMCTDRFTDPSWTVAQNHTFRPPYQELAWRWFRALP